jgi:hypothetical protein
MNERGMISEETYHIFKKHDQKLYLIEASLTELKPIEGS